MKQLFLLIAFVIYINALGRQSEPITFEANSHDFGLINEADGPVIHEFKFTNNSEAPITITNVKASCGCTTPAWTREEVAPGESGFIQAQYNPRNRPGRFNKTLTINASNGSVLRLMIRGEVNPRERTPEEMYPREFGALRMKYNSLNMGKVFINRAPLTRQFDIYNQLENSPVIITNVISPDHITVDFSLDTIPPKSKTSFTVTYDGALRDDLGFMNDSFQIATDQVESEEISLSVFATLEEYFAPLKPDELVNAPSLSFEEAVIDLGRIKKGETVTREIKLSNLGGSILNLRKLAPNCTCLQADLSTKNIEKGTSENLKMTFIAEGRRGNQQKSLTIYSNDPRKSAQRITVKAYIEEN